MALGFGTADAAADGLATAASADGLAATAGLAAGAVVGLGAAAVVGAAVGAGAPDEQADSNKAAASTAGLNHFMEPPQNLG
jgi:hypothetical protein